jgi:tRNA(Ile)-lysidine synthase
VHDRGSLWIAPKNEPKLAPLALGTGKSRSDRGDCFEVEIIPKSGVGEFLKDPWVGLFDADLLQFPLQVRHWQPGDRFRPLGMKGTKKLSDFFVDRKCSILEKEDSLVLLSAGQIVWVIGQQISDLFKLTEHTQRVCHIRVTPVSFSSQDHVQPI